MANSPTKLSRAGGVFSGAIMGAIYQPFVESSLTFMLMANRYKEHNPVTATVFNILSLVPFVFKLAVSPITGLFRGIKNGFKNGFKAGFYPMNIYTASRKAKMNRKIPLVDDSEAVMESYYSYGPKNDVPTTGFLTAVFSIMFTMGTIFATLAGAGTYSVFGFMLGGLALAGGALAAVTGGIFLVLGVLAVIGVAYFLNKQVNKQLKQSRVQKSTQLKEEHGEEANLPPRIQNKPKKQGVFARIKGWFSKKKNGNAPDKQRQQQQNDPHNNQMSRLHQDQHPEQGDGEREPLIQQFPLIQPDDDVGLQNVVNPGKQVGKDLELDDEQHNSDEDSSFGKD